MTLAVTAVAGDTEKVKQALGVQSMPWLILADTRRIILAEGFAPSDLDRTLEGLDSKWLPQEHACASVGMAPCRRRPADLHQNMSGQTSFHAVGRQI